MDTQDRVRDLTATFLDAHRDRIVEGLAERLGEAGSADLLPAHSALLDVVRAEVRDPDARRTVAGVHRALAGPGRLRDARSLIPGQMSLWALLHRMLRDAGETREDENLLHAVLALSGDVVDAVIGTLFDIVQSGDTFIEFPAWGTRVMVGRTRREFHVLNLLIRDLLDTRDPLQMFEILEAGILDTFHLRSLMMAIVSQKEGFVEIVQAYSPKRPAPDPAVGWRLNLSHPDILCEVARTGRMEVIDGWDSRYHERVVEADGSETFRQRPRDFNAGHTAFFVPILAGGRVVGVVGTGSTQASKAIVLQEIEWMRPFLDQVGATLSIVFEMADRKEAEEARQAAERELEAQRALSMNADRLRSLGEMAAGIAHELNQPLTGIRGLAEHLLIALDRRWDLPEEKMRERLAAIVEQADRMSHIIEHVRVFSREAGRPECRPVQVNEVIQSALGLLGTQFRSRWIEVGCELGEGLPCVSANPFSLEEVVLNLLLNARDAVEEKTGYRPPLLSPRERGEDNSLPARGEGWGGGRITDHGSREWEKRVWVRTRREGTGAEGWVVVEVADEGVGIPADLLEKVFDPFFTTKGPDRGTGLGLSVSRAIVEGFGGKVQIRSAPGRGTAVTVSFPVSK